jgi:hypothetical protein
MIDLECIERRVRRDVGTDLFVAVDFYVWAKIWRPIRLRLREALIPIAIERINR